MQVTVDKSRLLHTLRSNRDTHKKVYKEAIIGYRKDAIAALERRITRLKDTEEADKVRLYVNIETPTNHVDDYDRAIEMLEWEISDTATISDKQYTRFVKDDWEWKDTFISSTSKYSS